MARPLRILVPDGVYHVTSRGLERRDIARDDTDRRKWCDLLDRVATQRDWRVFAWALMSNHYHLFLRTPNGDLSAGMHDLNSGYVSVFNRRHDRHGPLLEGRFKAILVERAAHDWELTRYIHLNPVRAGIAETPEAYPWGSCRFYLGRGQAPRWLAWQEVLSQHATTLRAARRAYTRFLAEGLAQSPESPLKGVVASTLLGSESFVETVRDWLANKLPDRDVPAARELQEEVTVEAIEAAVCATFGAEPAALHDRRRWGNIPRAVAIYLCRRLTGTSIAAVGERFGGVGGAAVAKTCARLEERLRTNRGLARKVSTCRRAVEEMSNVKT